MLRNHTRLFNTRALENLKATNNKFNEKIKGTMVEKWVKYWKLVARDYKDVFASSTNEIKGNPLKSSIYFTGASLVGVCIKLNPNFQSFRGKYIECANNLSLVPTHLANPQATEHSKHIERCFNRKFLRYTNLGLFSIIWVDKYSEECDLYETNCSYLKVPYWDITNRILDVGLLNVWWIISRKMLNYDINY